MSIRFVRPVVAAALAMLVAASSAASRGSVIGYGFESYVDEADIVARVRVLDVAKRLKPNWLVEGMQDANGWPMHWNQTISRAEIVDPIKGIGKNAIIRIEHDNGLLCPNVRYKADHEYLVFVRKVPGTDQYETVGYYSGAYEIEKGFIEGFYLFKEKQPQQFKKAYAVISDVRRAWWTHAANGEVRPAAETRGFGLGLIR